MEEYKDLAKKPSKEMDRLKENIALRTKALEDNEKMQQEKDKALEEKIKGMEDEQDRAKHEAARRWVSAVNNIPAASYPSLYSSVISVAAHQGKTHSLTITTRH
jgi:hypothetical protein